MSYTNLPNYLLAFHGCNKEVFNGVIKNGKELNPSKNDYDWLGNGIYFWENSYERALDWAKQNNKEDPAVIGAIISLNNCLDLTNYEFTKADGILKITYNALETYHKDNNLKLPLNQNIKDSKDWLLRPLDCLVINTVCEVSKKYLNNGFDSVRGIFQEGNRIFNNAGFREKTHSQICIKNINCISGYFDPRNRV
jgi:hypothetical protein